MTRYTTKVVNWVKGYFPQSDFVRHVAVLAGGTALGQVIGVLVSPFLTRLYAPEAFGVFAVFVSLLAVVKEVASLRYELALPLPEKDETAANILVLCLGLVAGIGLLSAGVVWGGGDHVVTWLGAPALAPYLWLLPLGIVGGGIYKAFNNWAVRKKAFPRIARTKLNRSIGKAATSLGIGAFSGSPFGLLLGQVVGQASGVSTLVAITWKKDRDALSSVGMSGIWKAAVRYREFPLYSSWAGMINTLGVQVPIIMLTYFFGPAATGLYEISRRVMQAPMSLVGRAIAQVFFSNAAEARRAGNVRATTRNTFERLTQIGMPALALVAVSAPEMFAFVFGDEWLQAGVYAQWLCPWLFFVFVSSPISMLVSVLERQLEGLVFQVTLLSGRILALLAGGWMGDALLAVALYASVSAVCWFAFTVWIMHASGSSPRYTILHLTKRLALSLPLVLPALLFKALSIGDLWVLTATIFGGGVVAYKMMREMNAGTTKGAEVTT